MWIIKADRTCDPLDKELYWSNRLGWVDKESATIFTKEERSAVRLPIAGTWEQISTATDEMETVYLQNSGGKCLFCLSVNISAGYYEGDGDIVWCEVVCDDCCRTWQDNYKLYGILDLCRKKDE